MPVDDDVGFSRGVDLEVGAVVRLSPPPLMIELLFRPIGPPPPAGFLTAQHEASAGDAAVTLTIHASCDSMLMWIAKAFRTGG